MLSLNKYESLYMFIVFKITTRITQSQPKSSTSQSCKGAEVKEINQKTPNRSNCRISHFSRYLFGTAQGYKMKINTTDANLTFVIQIKTA